MNTTEEKLKNFAAYFPQDFTPKIAMVLGTRLSDFTKYIDDVRYVDFSEIQDFPIATGYGHKGRFAFGYFKGIPIIISDGRVHYYEGYPMDEVVLNIRLMRYLGADILIETNISGIINSEYSVGDIMILQDHISFFVPSPLIGISPRFREERFVNTVDAYDKELTQLLIECARDTTLTAHVGVYLQVGGPHYESPAEISAFRLLGADAIGMSTACEVVVARQLNMRVCGISYLSNVAGTDIDVETRKYNLKQGKNKAPEIFRLLFCFLEKLKDSFI